MSNTATDRPAGPFVWAHRGVSSVHLGNSIEAFALALDQGADGVELDVRLTSDGVPVVLHDPDLALDGGLAYELNPFARPLERSRRQERQPGDADAIVEAVRTLASATAGAHRALVSELSWNELAACARVDVWTGRRYAIASLDEVLAAVGGKLVLDIEIKGVYAESAVAVGIVADAVRRAGVVDTVAIAAFDHRFLRAMSSELPEVRLMAITHARLVDYAAAIAAIPRCELDIDLEFLDAATVRELQAAGIVVHAGGLGDRRDVETVARWGVDAVCVEDLDLVAGLA